MLLAAIYLVLTETFTVQNAAVGLIVSVLALYLTNTLFLKQKIRISLNHAGHYTVFVCCLFGMIFKSAVLSFGFITAKNTGVKVIRYKTTLSSDYLKSMLANAVTLTPGTVTANIKGSVLEILQLCRPNGRGGNTAIERMERILKRMDGGEK